MSARRILVASLLAASVHGASAVVSPVLATEWRPVVTERLVRIPARHLERAIQRDYAASGLAGAIGEIEGRISAQRSAISDIEAAIEGTPDDAVVRELRHRLLREKRDLLAAFGERTDLDRSRLETKIRLMERLRKKHDRRRSASQSAEESIDRHRTEARARLEAASAKVADALADSGRMPDSAYSEAYERNEAALDRLREAIAAHPMNRDGGAGDGDPASAIARVLAESEAKLAVLSQEEAVIGHMARLLSLDAQSFAKEMEEMDGGTSDGGSANSVVSVVDLFTN